MTQAAFTWTDIGVVTHAVGAFAFLLLFALMATGWRGCTRALLLLAAVLTTGFWGISGALHAGTRFVAWSGAFQTLDVLRLVAWLVLLLSLLDGREADGQRRSKFPIAGGAAIAVVAAGLLVMGIFPAATPLSVDLRIAGHMLLALFGLVLVEQVFRSSVVRPQSAGKYLCLGVGGLLMYDLFLYSDALLFRRIDPALWNGRGLIPAIVAPLLAMAAKRHTHWSIDLFVSRTAAVHTMALVGTGLYLLVMAAVAYYIRTHGGSWGSAVQAVFLFGAILLLIAMLFSEQLRARARVFFSKHFYNYQYDYREEWLRFIRTLADSAEPDTRIRSIRALAQILDSPGGILWTLDEWNVYRCTACWRLSAADTPTMTEDCSLIDFLQTTGWVIDLDEYRREPGHYRNLQPPPELLDLRTAWLVVPLLHSDRLLGFVVLEHSPSRTSINWEDHDLLKTAGQQVSSYLALLNASEALARARQFDAFNRLSAYVVHDLKNVVSQLSLVAANAERHRSNAAFIDDVIRTVRNSTEKMNGMLADLRQETGHPLAARGIVRIGDVVTQVVERRSAQQPEPEVRQLHPDLIVRGDGARFAAVLEHLVQNAQDATPEFGEVSLSVRKEKGHAVIEISDTGCGMDREFVRSRLFRPFDTTKGSAGMGIGVYEAREFVGALGGTVDVQTQLSEGTTFVISVPLATAMERGTDNPFNAGANL